MRTSSLYDYMFTTMPMAARAHGIFVPGLSRVKVQQVFIAHFIKLTIHGINGSRNYIVKYRFSREVERKIKLPL